jgi:hypothetical protein
MSGIEDLDTLIREMKPHLNKGEYVFTVVSDLKKISLDDIIGHFKEKEGITIILERKKADLLNLSYNFIASWITLKIHSSLDALGLTAAFSSELTKNNISCNVIAGFYHDHIFVSKKDETDALKVLINLSNKSKD